MNTHTHTTTHMLKYNPSTLQVQLLMRVLDVEEMCLMLKHLKHQLCLKHVSCLISLPIVFYVKRAINLII